VPFSEVTKSRGCTVKLIQVRKAARVAATLVMALLAAVGQAQTYSVLYKFQGNPDGANPSAGVIRDATGNLYGTTSAGGASNVGTVFKLSKTGETVLYSFCPGGPPCTDGANPGAGLVQDAIGNLYGTAGGGTGCSGRGCGVVFRLDTTGKETVLYSFCPAGIPCTDGANPSGGLIQDGSGDFYGTTMIGGGSGCRNGYGCGTVFRLDTNGTETVLYSFTGFPDGQYPGAGVIRDGSGNFYGTTGIGGIFNKGTVFKLNNAGVESVLRSFKARTDGKSPAGVIRDADGNLYGTAASGGGTGCGGPGCGVVFKLDVTGKETVLHRFAGGDGAAPVGLIRDAGGNLYGTTVYGGRCDDHGGCGIVFKLNKNGKLTVLHTMKGGADGRNPNRGVIRDARGNLYGTTFYGGDLSCGQGQGCGVVFKLTP
jgi:uncharacterized repeat protein (TIGR03803 family)